ncbi:MAG: glycosyltransferase family 39 protein, partial [Firmicutes bacterium]|nr:glycosyltransferase family 39 protein [Bacillota bacterium]
MFITEDTGTFDTDTHFFWALDYNRVLFEHKNTLSCENLQALCYPPVVYVITQSFFALFGKTIIAARISLLPFWLIFIFSLYGLSERIGGKAGAFLVLGLVLSSPHILNVSRAYMCDFPQIAMIAATIMFLLKSETFSSKKYSILFGMCMGITLLVKLASVYVLALPVIIVCIIALIRSRIQIGKRLFYLLPFLTVSLCFFIVYSYNRAHFMVATDIWLFSFVVLVLIPCLITLYKYILECRGGNKEEDCRFHNISCSFALFSLIASPWLLWASKTILVKARSDGEFIALNSANPEVFSNFFATMFVLPVFWLLVASGVYAVLRNIKQN